MVSSVRFSAQFSTLLLILLLPIAIGFVFDKDTGENCEEKVSQCTTDSHVFFLCPITCSTPAEPYTPARRIVSTPDAFYEFEGFDRFEGYVTVVAGVPMLPGVAQYYYEMLEHIHTVFPYTVELVLIPQNVGDHPIKPHEKPKVLILETEHPALHYLEESVLTTLDRNLVNVFILAIDAHHIERQVMPTLHTIDHYIRRYSTQLMQDEF